MQPRVSGVVELPQRLLAREAGGSDLPLAEADPTTYYTGGSEGYLTYSPYRS
ncbi:hypothetical protein [Streptomyces malaysiensis]